MGIINKKYMAGINLGGWISQCDLDPGHIASFITKEDICQIASWQMDHVRLPFDCEALECGGYDVIDNLLSWCDEYNLNVLLDMHKSPGYAHNMPTQNITLFTDTGTQDKFASIWETLAKRYKGLGDNLIFELLNEVRDPCGDIWNKLSRRVIETIHKVDPSRYILLGGPYYNSAEGLKTLDIWDNEQIIYNFHYYQPFTFTHQRAPWTHLKDIDIMQPYPGQIMGMEMLSHMTHLLDIFGGTNVSVYERGMYDMEFLKETLEPAIDFMKQTGKGLYCGEYGAIDRADMQSRINYAGDIAALFTENGIGRAYWTYKSMSFAAVDKDGHIISEDLVKAISTK